MKLVIGSSTDKNRLRKKLYNKLVIISDQIHDEFHNAVGAVGVIKNIRVENESILIGIEIIKKTDLSPHFKTKTGGKGFFFHQDQVDFFDEKKIIDYRLLKKIKKIIKQRRLK